MSTSHSWLPERLWDRVTQLALWTRSTVGGDAEALAVGRMKIHVVCYEDYHAWILGKIARRLVEALQARELDVTLGKRADPAADINHHVIYYDYVDRAPTIETVMITHIDSDHELNKVKRQLIDQGVDMGICMSREAVSRLARNGVPRDKLCFISPAHDGLVRPRKTLIGLMTRLYPDGCKREHLLDDLGAHISADDFRFAIMGAGWGPIVERLLSRGFEVTYHDHFDEPAYLELMPALDYYLYLGNDEGSMGLLDALAAGVPTIATPQGFHLDVAGGITHAFEDLEGLIAVFNGIAQQKRARAASVSSWTWDANARKHLLVWEYLLANQRGRLLPATVLRELDALDISRARFSSAASGSTVHER